MNQDAKASPPWFVYVVRCADDTLYTGITTNTLRRINEHNAGTPPGARYTRSRRPVTLAYVEGAASRRTLMTFTCTGTSFNRLALTFGAEGPKMRLFTLACR